MVTWRYHKACNVCGKPFLLRIQVGYEDQQSFAAPCPNCGTMLEGVFEPKREDKNQISCKLLTTVEGSTVDIDVEHYPVLNLACDLPMYLDGIHRQSLLTPFMEVQGLAQKTWFEVVYPRRHPDAEFVRQMLPGMIESHLAGESSLFKLQARQVLDNTDLALPDSPRCVYLLNVMRVVIFSSQNSSMFQCLDELRAAVHGFFRRDPAVRQAFIAELDTALVAELKRKVLRSVNALIALDGPLTAAFFVQEIKRGGHSLEKLRSVRGDYKLMARVYLEVFEAASFGLAFHAAIENVAIRNSVALDNKSEKFSFRKALRYDAKDREYLASGELGALYGEISRQTRNKIGHNAAHYDFKTGLIEFDDGKTVSLLDLQMQLLQLLRLSAWLVELTTVIDLLASREHIPKELYREPRMTVEGGTTYRQRPS